MNYNCPNSNCQKSPFNIVKDGHYRRKSDSRHIQRFKCKTCQKKFSKATFTLERYQKKRRINHQVGKLLSSGMSLRRCALVLGVNPKTIERRLPYLAAKARARHVRQLKLLERKKIVHLQFDDLITKENSKLKPLSISIAVDADSRLILAGKVSQIPAFGHLAQVAKKKYGRRECHHRIGLEALFKEIRPVVHPNSIIKSDEHKKYPEFVQRYFPKAEYVRHKSERGCVAGQGELKKVKYDPLFAINHTCAMFRANINRLIRKTWCTTKDPQKLQDHVDLFIDFYNRVIIKESAACPHA